VEGQLRSEKFLILRGLNENHNHDLKAIFKSAATRASSCAGPFQDFYQALLAKGLKKREGRGVALFLSFFRLSRGKTYPMGVLLELAPEPEVSTRITPD
jgi:hypothetical protein